MTITAHLRRAALPALAVVFAGFALVRESGVVNAYALTGVHWAGSSVDYRINPNFVDAAAGNSAAQIAAVQAGADAWAQQAQIPFSFNYLGTTSVSTVAYDGTNAVFYSGNDGGGALAVCFYWSIGGFTQQFDIEYYDRWAGAPGGSWDFVWAVSPTVSQFDIQSVAAHEFGHALGLDHSATTTATMYASVSSGSTAYRTLDPDDVNGAQSIYGVEAPVVDAVSPLTGFAGGGDTITITGQNFSTDELYVFVAGLPASNVTWVSPTQLTCTTPAAAAAVGLVTVAVCSSGLCDQLLGAFTYETIDVANATPNRGSITRVDVAAPVYAGDAYLAMVSLGTTGIQLNSLYSPSDPRVIPLAMDELLLGVMSTGGSPHFYNMGGSLNGFGRAYLYFAVPNEPYLAGLPVHFAVATFDAGATSGISHVSNRTTMTLQ
jgi:hypothetical protein